ncbi:FBD domain - like 1 [Theobroma cacao]|nr:FBD domain - like 1 [Theobroma cacao]
MSGGENTFEKLRHCKIFRLCSRRILCNSTIFPSVCSKAFNTSQPANLSFEWKYLELKLIQMKWHHPVISYLLRSSPLLETLDLYICPKWPDKVKYEAPFGEYLYNMLQEQYHDNGGFWSSQEGTFHCLEHHLKTVRICGDVRELYVIQFIEFLLKNALVLEKLMISTKKTFQPTQLHAFSRAIAHPKDVFSTEKWLEVFQKLCSLPRASRSAFSLYISRSISNEVYIGSGKKHPATTLICFHIFYLASNLAISTG